MDIALRLERTGDFRIVEELTREAFYNTSGTLDEHLLVHKLRLSEAFVPELDYVAEAEGRIVGNIMYSLAAIVDDRGKRYEVLAIDPLSVLPAYQKKGVGSALVRHTVREAKMLNFRAIVIGGHPDYYPRFGFQRAAALGILHGDGAIPPDGMMAMPLYEGALDGVSGRFMADPSFVLPDPEELRRFDATFPPLIKRGHTSLNVVLERISPDAQKAVKMRGLSSLNDFRGYSGREIMSWPGMTEADAIILNNTLIEYGYPKKVLPIRETHA